MINKFLKVTLFIFTLVIVIEIGHLISTSINQKYKLAKSTTFPSLPLNTSTTSITQEKFRVIFQKKDDIEGRSVIYESKEYKFPGVGEFSVDPLNPELSKPLIGEFKEWGSIENSQD